MAGGVQRSGTIAVELVVRGYDVLARRGQSDVRCVILVKIICTLKEKAL